MKGIFAELHALGYGIDTNRINAADGTPKIGLTKDGEHAEALLVELPAVVSGRLTLKEIAARRAAENGTP